MSWWDAIQPTRAQIIWLAVVCIGAGVFWAVAGEDRPWKSRRKP